MAEAAGGDKPIRVVGAEAKRIKREALGVPDRIKHQQRVAVPMQRRAPEADTRASVSTGTAATQPPPRPSN
ncbi:MULTISPECIES: hypothetical protein [unclassified Streptomyces]|uniref:hypothetical protein n=1 Tax=unclassified Streptomyces TaxID=2593676 RepID=UPI0024A82F06|nr:MULTISPECIES: hypothetical protein [unclassified Streptomyces]